MLLLFIPLLFLCDFPLLLHVPPYVYLSFFLSFFLSFISLSMSTFLSFQLDAESVSERVREDMNIYNYYLSIQKKSVLCLGHSYK